MRHLRPEDYRVMPWKNGGGATTEIAIHPQGSGISGASFIWRVSIAEVAVDGPFSRFPGYERHIMTIAGKGMSLDAGDHGTIDLSEPFKPRQFSGDWEVYGRLIDGAVRDFNLMVARNAAQGSLTVESLSRKTTLRSPEAALLIYILEGDGIVEGRIVAEGDTLILDRGESIAMSPGGESIRLAIASIAVNQGA